MKKAKKLTVKPSVSGSAGCTYENHHDFLQVFEPINYLHAGANLSRIHSSKGPSFICRKCGKVIQL